MGCPSRKKPCIGDLKSRVTLQSRAITEPLFVTPEFTETFSLNRKVWAKIVTNTGKIIFDGVSSDIRITHTLTIRWDREVTTETWVLLDDNTRLDIVNVEDVDEEHDFLVLACTERGDADLAASEA